MGASSERRTRPSDSMRRCAPPGASSSRVASTVSPGLASTTLSGLEPSRRVASEAVKPAGMCWTITEPLPSGDGSLGISSPRAFGPPVEEAIMTNLRVPLRWRTAGRGAIAGGAGAAGRGAKRRRLVPLSAASLTFFASSVVNASSDSPIAGLATRSNAPSARASTTRAPWAGENAETTTTGTGSALPARSARRTPRPSRPGMWRSSVSASGRCASHAARASSPAAAVATTSKPCRPSASARMRRIRRESSATTTRCALVGVLATEPVLLRRGELVGADAREQTLGVEEDDEAVADLGDRLDRLHVGRRDGLELLGGDGEDLLDVAHDDAGLAGARLDDHDLAELGARDVDADPRSEVVDRDDLAAQADDAADPRHVGGDRTRLGETDDLVDRTDREGVLLRTDREDDELLGSDVGHVHLCIGKHPSGLSRLGLRPALGSVRRSALRARRAAV